MAIGDDFSVAANGDIRWTGTSATYTVLQLHRWLQDLADDAVASGDDLMDISVLTPSDRSTDNIITLINGYNITDTEAEHLYNGSIRQNGGDDVFSGLVVVGAVEAGTNLQIVQDGALLTNYWGSGLNADAGANILLRLCVRTREAGADIDGQRILVQARELGDTYSEFSATLGLGNSTAAIFTSNDLNNDTVAGTIATWDQFTNTEGYQQLDITGDAVTEPYYAQWTITGGGSTPASPTVNDLYEYTKWVQRRATAETLYGLNGELFRGITHDITYDNELNGPFTESAEVYWGTKFDYDTETGASSWTVGEYLSIGTAVGKLLAVWDNGTTGTMVVAVEGGATISDGEAIAQLDGGDMTALVNDLSVEGNGVIGGTGQLLAVDDDGTTGRLFLQLKTGVAPLDSDVIYQGTPDSTETSCDVNVTITSRTISPEFIGTSTGSAIIGAYGIAVDPTDTTASDQFFDLDNTLRVPPNNVTFTVSGLESGEDRVLVGPESGGLLQLGQFTTAATYTSATQTTIQINTTIPSDTPKPSGTIRVERDSGIYERIAYSNYTGDTFTVTSTDFSTDNATLGNNVFISYIDKLAAAASESFTSVYSSDRALFIRVRDGGVTPIKTFETTGTLGSAGGSSTAIRTTDA